MSKLVSDVFDFVVVVLLLLVTDLSSSLFVDVDAVDDEDDDVDDVDERKNFVRNNFGDVNGDIFIANFGSNQSLID